MGVLVTLAILWLALIVSVVVIYAIGPPARRLLGLRREVEAAVEDVRRQSTLNQEQVVSDLQQLDWPIDSSVRKYQDARRQILPGAPDHCWGAKELASWSARELALRGRSLRQRNLFSLITWNLAVTVLLGTVAWFYYQHVQSKSRPQLHVPSSSYSSTR